MSAIGYPVLLLILLVALITINAENKTANTESSSKNPVIATPIPPASNLPTSTPKVSAHISGNKSNGTRSTVGSTANENSILPASNKTLSSTIQSESSEIPDPNMVLSTNAPVTEKSGENATNKKYHKQDAANSERMLSSMHFVMQILIAFLLYYITSK